MANSANSSVSYVRTEMLPGQSPPVSEAGVVKWVRENLFSGPLNTILTILSLVAIYWVVSHVFQWFAYGIWTANSLSECREVRDALYADGRNVACWAVLSERWNQLLFGFYPADAYWRPVVALIVFFSAVAPVMFNFGGRKLAIFSAVSPFICYWLLWGGSIWGPILTALGFVLAWLAYGQITRQFGALAGILASILVPLIYWRFGVAPLTGLADGILPIGIENIQSKDFGGFMLALIIGITGIVLSLPLGILLALGRQSDLFIINKFSVIFIEVIRGVPLIVWLFTASLLLNYFLPPGTNFDLMLRVIIMVTLFAAAYMAEVVRGGLAALPRGQYEGADSLGLDYWQSMRLIILPQALKISIPGIVNTFIGLFKDTTLVVFIGLLDPIGLSNAIRATTEWNGIYWELFIFIGLCFFVFCYAMSRYSQYLERKLATDRH